MLPIIEFFVGDLISVGSVDGMKRAHDISFWQLRPTNSWVEMRVCQGYIYVYIYINVWSLSKVGFIIKSGGSGKGYI